MFFRRTQRYKGINCNLNETICSVVIALVHPMDGSRPIYLKIIQEYSIIGPKGHHLSIYLSLIR
jgi:hypothetical protein